MFRTGGGYSKNPYVPRKEESQMQTLISLSDHDASRRIESMIYQKKIPCVYNLYKLMQAVNGLLRGGGTSSSSEDLHVFEGGVVGLLPFPPSKKRYRRKFTVEQKERMRVEDSEAG
ncbi:hypothetical protein FF2_028193 [Malus domestica]